MADQLDAAPLDPRALKQHLPLLREQAIAKALPVINQILLAHVLELVSRGFILFYDNSAPQTWEVWQAYHTVLVEQYRAAGWRVEPEPDCTIQPAYRFYLPED
jgi:hypothetical protein